MSSRGISSPSTAATASPCTQHPDAQAPEAPDKQFFACEPCRTQKQRCDLKDLPPSTSGRSLCSNCILDYVEQVEAINGSARVYSDNGSLSRAPNPLPALKREFFTSKFWAWLRLQRPILGNEFSQRYLAHIEGRASIGPEGVILTMLLVIWAASFGLDESGSPIKHDSDDRDIRQVTGKTCMLTIDMNSQDDISLMLKQILTLIGSRGILRRPTLDGVRILLLTAPLMDEIPYFEKAAIYEAAYSHVRVLCNPRVAPSSPEERDMLIRVLLDAHIQGITTTLKYGHPGLRSKDYDTLRMMISSSTDYSNLSPIYTTSLPGTATTCHLFEGQIPSALGKQLTLLNSMPLRLSSVCCKIRETLTGFKAARLIEDHGLLDANGMREIWHSLEQCWHEFMAIKRDGIVGVERADVEWFTDAWLIFIFECHNIILDSLKSLTFNAHTSEHTTHAPASDVSADPASQSSALLPLLPPCQLYLQARMHCVRFLPHVLRIVRYHLVKRVSGGDTPNIFTWDMGLIRDGCLFAGLLAADLYSDAKYLGGRDSEIQGEETDEYIAPEEGVNLILSAVAEMHWVFSKSDELSETIRATLQRSKEKPRDMVNPYALHCQCPLSLEKSSTPDSCSGGVKGMGSTCDTPTVDRVLPSVEQRESASNAPCDTDETRSNGWPQYTPVPTVSPAASPQLP